MNKAAAYRLFGMLVTVMSGVLFERLKHFDGWVWLICLVMAFAAFGVAFLMISESVKMERIDALMNDDYDEDFEPEPEPEAERGPAIVGTTSDGSVVVESLRKGHLASVRVIRSPPNEAVNE